MKKPAGRHGSKSCGRRGGRVAQADVAVIHVAEVCNLRPPVIHRSEVANVRHGQTSAAGKPPPRSALLDAQAEELSIFAVEWSGGTPDFDHGPGDVGDFAIAGDENDVVRTA
jgi:hypothetical protein